MEQPKRPDSKLVRLSIDNFELLEEARSAMQDKMNIGKLTFSQTIALLSQRYLKHNQ